MEEALQELKERRKDLTLDYAHRLALEEVAKGRRRETQRTADQPAPSVGQPDLGQRKAKGSSVQRLQDLPPPSQNGVQEMAGHQQKSPAASWKYHQEKEILAFRKEETLLERLGHNWFQASLALILLAALVRHGLPWLVEALNRRLR